MNKFILALSILITCSITFAGRFNCKKFTILEFQKAQEKLKYKTGPERFLKLKELISEGDINDQATFAKIRALMCVNWDWLNRERVFFTRPFAISQWWEDLTRAEDFSEPSNSLIDQIKKMKILRSKITAAYKEELRELLAIAIKRGAKKVISLIYSQIYPKAVFQARYAGYIEFLGSIFLWHDIQFKNDLDILTDNVGNMDNSIEIAQHLLSFRSTEEDPFSEYVKDTCNRLCSDERYSKYCQFIEEKMKLYGPQHDPETFEKNLEEFGI